MNEQHIHCTAWGKLNNKKQLRDVIDSAIVNVYENGTFTTLLCTVVQIHRIKQPTLQ
jgi:hypothetical protein